MKNKLNLDLPIDILSKSLRRWVQEKWAARDGSTDYKSGKKGWRPTRRVSDKTPQTWSEMTPAEKKRKEKNKEKANKRGGGWSTHLKNRKAVYNTKKSEKISDLEDLGKAEYKGRKVRLNKPFRTPGGPKKYAVYVKDPKTGNIKKVAFGDPNLSIKRHRKNRRKNFRARHNCDNPGPKTKARYWSCKFWSRKKVSDLV